MRRGHRDEGQATVELALVLPFLVLMLLAVLQVGVVARDRIAVAHVARVAARAAVEDPTPAHVVAAARAASSLDAAALSVSVSGGESPGAVVRVLVRYRSPTSVPLIGPLVDDVSFSEQFVAERG